MSRLYKTQPAILYGLIQSAARLGWGRNRGAAHRQGNTPPCKVYVEDGDRHFLVHLHDVARILDVTVGKLTDMHETVLMHADVDKDAEGGDVRHDAREFHPRLDVLDFFDALGKA